MNMKEGNDRLHKSERRNDEPRQYRISVNGHLNARWSAWFDDMTITRESDGTTILQGPVADQAALHGLLQKVRDLGLALISVTRIQHD